MTRFYLSAITVYPVKSLAGINASSWPVTKTGLQHDRKWMLIDRDGQFLSQRKLPTMALIHPAITGQHLILSAPGMENLVLPLNPKGGEIIESTVWADQCSARSVSDNTDRWLSQFLKQECRLVYMPDECIRPVDQNYGLPTDNVAFSDAFPFLIVSEDSLNVLNKEMPCDLPMSRFRPNLVVSGCPAYAEDGWREIQVGSIDFRLPKPCSRCSIPAIDPETAETGKEPLITLNRTRRWQNHIYFGQNALHDQTGHLSVGDAVIVKTTGPKQPPL